MTNSFSSLQSNIGRPPRERALVALLFLFCVLLASLCAQAGTKPLLVHYMPWYVAKPYSGSWGWHWTMNHYNPDTTNSIGQRQIASWYYPLIDPYDSADPVVLEYHVLLMKLSGIDGVIVDWYGQDDYLDYAINNQRTLALLTQTRRAGLKFSLCFEDRTVQEKINGNYITSSNAIANAQQTMLYAQANYFASPNYLQISNRPVFLNFGPQFFKLNSDWLSIFSVLAPSNQPAFFTEDSRLPVGWGAFDWPPMYLSQQNGGVLTTTALENYLASFQSTAAAWPAFVSSVFPRFKDIYQQAGLGFTYGTLADNGGTTFKETFQRALTNNSALIQLVTWNDYGEGTVIEPTVDFGYRDLGVIQDYRRQYLEPGFVGTTNEVALAYRFYQLRRQYLTNKIASAELGRTFTNLVKGDLATARSQITALEQGLPLVYNTGLSNTTLQFAVGGYISPNGAEIQTTSNLAVPWQTAGPLAVGTNSMSFSSQLSTQSGPTFFRVRTTNP